MGLLSVVVVEIQLGLGNVLIQVWRGNSDVSLNCVRSRSYYTVRSLPVPKVLLFSDH